MVSGYSAAEVFYVGTKVATLFPLGSKFSQPNPCKIKFLVVK